MCCLKSQLSPEPAWSVDSVDSGSGGGDIMVRNSAPAGFGQAPGSRPPGTPALRAVNYGEMCLVAVYKVFFNILLTSN